MGTNLKQSEISMTRTDFIKSLSKHFESDTKLASAAVEEIIAQITETLKSGDDLLISGFGKFFIQEKKSRKGRNPQTGDSITIKARKVVKLRASDILKNILASAALNAK